MVPKVCPAGAAAKKGGLAPPVFSTLVSYYLYDGQLSTRQLTDDAGTVTDTYIYDAFGSLTFQSGATENNYLYTCEQYDSSVKCYYLRARYYDQAAGRFLTTDPLEGSALKPATLHKYIYASNNPVMFFDPSGEMTIGSQLAAIASFSVLASMAISQTHVSHLTFRDRRIRLNHYTRWETMPLIMANGIDSPSGTNYFTPDWYFIGRTAKSKLAMPKKPELVINLTLYLYGDELQGPSEVEPANNEFGGGSEYKTTMKIPLWSRMPVIIPLL